MSRLDALLRAYNHAEEMGIVDLHDENQTVLLPLYHNNMRSTGENIIEVTLDENSNIKSVSHIPKDAYIIFPVTYNSVSRSGKYPPSHPLVDKIPYVLRNPVDDKKHERYLEELESFRAFVKEPEIRKYLDCIFKFVNNGEALSQIVKYLYSSVNYKQDGLKIEYLNEKEKKRTDNLEEVFITFKIYNFSGLQDVSVTEYVELHRAYVE